MTHALRWAVKSSFVEYVEALGEVEIIPPASRDDEGLFRFPESPGGERFNGGLAFRAHHGAMDLVISDPWIEAGQLTVEFTDHGRSEGRIVLADVEDDGRTALALSGAVVFDFTYPVGTELAIIVSWPPLLR